MIVKAWNKAHVVYQTADADDEIPNGTLLVHVDQGGTLVIQQEDQSIVLNWATVPELLKLAKKLTPNGNEGGNRG